MNCSGRFILTLGIVFFAGCSWFHSGPSRQKETFDEFKLSGRIVDRTTFKKGGKLLIIPFKAGSGIEANKELDKVSFKIIQGIADALGEKDSNFEVVFGEEGQSADFVLRGYITDLEVPSMGDSLLLRQKKLAVGVRGKMADSDENSTIMVFRTKKEGLQREQDFLSLGYLVGLDLGRFLTDGY